MTGMMMENSPPGGHARDNVGAGDRSDIALESNLRPGMPPWQEPLL